jgi:hypothetical protein
VAWLPSDGRLRVFRLLLRIPHVIQQGEKIDRHWAEACGRGMPFMALVLLRRP